ncbi:MAG: hypothetical protein Q7R95_04235 [bacterium]|nr:hypothetical protein [bacterium]
MPDKQIDAQNRPNLNNQVDNLTNAAHTNAALIFTFLFLSLISSGTGMLSIYFKDILPSPETVNNVGIALICIGAGCIAATTYHLFNDKLIHDKIDTLTQQITQTKMKK